MRAEPGRWDCFSSQHESGADVVAESEYVKWAFSEAAVLRECGTVF
jgi:hypothetical protein